MALAARLTEPAQPRPDTRAGTYDDHRIAARREARLRMRLIKRRRLDLLQDAGLGLLLAVFVLVETAGLGVVAILAGFTAVGLLGSLVAERRLRNGSAKRPDDSA